jgi:hypothetical protein
MLPSPDNKCAGHSTTGAGGVPSRHREANAALRLDRLLRGLSGATDEFTLAAAVQKLVAQGPPAPAIGAPASVENRQSTRNQGRRTRLNRPEQRANP